MSLDVSASKTTAERKGILTTGNWIVDHVKVIDTWPTQDALANIESEYRGTGGAPFNVSIALARLGVNFPLAGAGIIGNDEPGDWIIQTCRKFGVDTSLISRTSEAPTSYTDVMTVHSTGRRTFFHQRGANSLLDEQTIPLGRSNAKILHLGYLLLLDQLDRPDKIFRTKAAALFKSASDLGFITSADVVSEESDRYARIVLPALPYLDIVFLNEFEAARILSFEIRQHGQIDVPTLLNTAEVLVAAGVRRWIIIHFPEGVFAASKDGQRIFQPSLRLPRDWVKGLAGAGDAIAAGVLLGTHDELPMEQSLIFGICTAAASLRHPSCTEGIESIDRCLALSHELGYQRSIMA
jgi:sugar/nucleoside kinase (ribokinase family)